MKKYLFIAVALMLTITAAHAQKNRTIKGVNPLGTSASPIYSDTVTNSATNYLTINNTAGNSQETTVQVVCTEISGTTGGTLSLLGSLDGTNYKALTVRDSSDVVPTFTPTDVASQNFIWRITGNPCLYYRVSWTGTGTMAASFTATLLSREQD